MHVIVDASFSKARWRDEAAGLAAETDADLTELRCLLPQETAAARLRQRAADGDDASDATPAVAATMATEFEGWPSAAFGRHPPTRGGRPARLSLTCSGRPGVGARARLSPDGVPR